METFIAIMVSTFLANLQAQQAKIPGWKAQLDLLEQSNDQAERDRIDTVSTWIETVEWTAAFIGAGKGTFHVEYYHPLQKWIWVAADGHR